MKTLLAISLAVAATAAGQETASPAALVASLTGRASLAVDAARRPLRAYDWVPAGAGIVVASSSAVELILIDGRRFRLGAGARIRLASNDLVVVHPPVSALGSVPPLPDLAPIAAGAPRQSAAVRIRGGVATALYPCERARALADSVELRFEPPPAARRFDVRVRAADGTEAFFVSTDQPRVRVPPGTLQAGVEYLWSVRPAGAAIEAERRASFETLDATGAARRAALRDRMMHEGSLHLLAVIDQRLGLFAEAVDDLDSALAHAPRDPSAAHALAAARGALADRCR
ncbi:MAG: hypothetical protein DMF86_16760 [Acidobacteria bacterium]|nr:MAG: hypothetical protein DMF86_16760 [Acidobacteriota bacterium]